MFIRRIKRKNGQVSIVLVEGYRENGKVKQRTVKYLGTESQLIKEDPQAIDKLVEKYRNQESQSDAFINMTLDLKEKIPEKKLAKNYGYFFLEKMYSDLGLDTVCKNITSRSNAEYSLDECLKLMCFMRALRPSSKKSCLEKGNNYFLADWKIKLEQIYKSLTVLKDHKKEFIEQMHKAICRLYARKTDVLYYDVTNYFFEIDEQDDFRKKGCSKEHRPLPIVQMGLFIDGMGLPVDFYLYEGNKPDCATLKPSFEQVKKNYNTGKVIITADKGLNSKSNLGYILSHGDGYIVSQKIRGASRELLGQVLSEDGWKSVPDGDFELKEFIRQTPVEYPDGTVHQHAQKVVCIWSEKYATKEKCERDALLERVAALANNPSKFKISCHQGMKKYIVEQYVDGDTGEVANPKLITCLDMQKIQRDESLDGYYLIVTSETDLSISEILKKYRGLWRIEQSFRITKTDLKSRPVFVRTREHIESHFLTCFIALTLLRMLEIRLDRQYPCHQIVDGINSAMATEMNKGIYIIDQRDKVVDALEKSFGASLCYRYTRAEDIYRYQKKINDAVFATAFE